MKQTLTVTSSSLPARPKVPGDKEPSAAIAKGTEKGLTALEHDLQREHAVVGRLIEQDFQTKRLLCLSLKEILRSTLES